jgi:hypothetical protein
MIGFRSSLLATAVIALAASIAPAHAQQARSFVSGLGSDLNAPNCTRTAPCRTFQTAHNNTLPSGEIAVLDPGSYGAVTIDRNISIINDGVGEAGALVSGGANGITINAGATDAVTLRGLTIKGIGFGGGNGIVFNTGKSLKVENCIIRNMTGFDTIGSGIIYAPSSVSALSVSDTVLSDNSVHGIVIEPILTGSQGAVLTHIDAQNNGANGVYVVGAFLQPGGGMFVTVSDSVSANNAGGFRSTSIEGKGTAILLVSNSVVARNKDGLVADHATLAVESSKLFGNSSAASVVNGGTMYSYGDNVVFFNGNNLSANPISKQ